MLDQLPQDSADNRDQGPFNPAASAGLFVGVSIFEDKQFNPVPFAVDDAVDLAHFFTIELGAVLPERAVILLAGEPRKPESTERLEHLVKRGVRLESARMPNIYRYVGELTRATEEGGLFIFTVATHRISDQGEDFLVATDSLKERAGRTGVAVVEVFEEIGKAGARRRVVFLDACHEQVSQRTPSQAGSAKEQNSTEARFCAADLVLLSSATFGELAYDDEVRQNGVFTAAVLDGLRGEASAGPDGWITSQTLEDFVQRRVSKRISLHRPDHAAKSLDIAGIKETTTVEALPLAPHPEPVRERQRYRPQGEIARAKFSENLGASASRESDLTAKESSRSKSKRILPRKRDNHDSNQISGDICWGGAEAFTLASMQPIRILAPLKEAGDCFARLVADLFFTLGYDHPRLNIHKTGREIDVFAQHRTESRIAMAECKASSRPSGGDDINKFYGVLDAERRGRNIQIKEGEVAEELVGYFISLAGYTETALEQEGELRGRRLKLLNGKQIVEELVKGRIVVSPKRAFAKAGQYAAGLPDLISREEQLIAHSIGWVWIVYFSFNAQITHFALVHGDGEILSSDLATRIIEADQERQGVLCRLTCLNPTSSAHDVQRRRAESQIAYFRYLAIECGQIELEGLPADLDIRERRLHLENIFVPLHLEKVETDTASRNEISPSKLDEHGSHEGRSSASRYSVGQVLAESPRLAILALPGGGKTTLLRRLAVAYAFPERRRDAGDNLPNRKWFPLLIRCRQIEEQADHPIVELLCRLGKRAELLDEQIEDFNALVSSKIREGVALLLVDGVDEISDSRLRKCFILNLRTFLATYPGVSVVITSREVGFRLIAGALASHCALFRIASFDRKDVERLTISWHREMAGDREEVQEQARSLATSIWENDRVQQLATNPLLLTTLLLVRRWVGQLPSQRSVLYEKAIEVLLWTWNIEGFKPLPAEEVIPQLAFLAWQMLKDRVYQVSQLRLRAILLSARQQMPEILRTARLSVDELVERVERRSSLLVVSGQCLESGRIIPVYEFRHLTFQEYLAARALVDEYYPDRLEGDTLVSSLRSHFQDKSWKEVIPLVASLAGRKTPPLIEALVHEAMRRKEYSTLEGWIILQCLLDEVPMWDSTVERALEVVARIPWQGTNPWTHPIYRLAGGSYGSRLREVIWNAYSTSKGSPSQRLCLGDALLAMGFADRNWPHHFSDPILMIEVKELSRSKEPREYELGWLLGIQLAVRR